MRTYTVHQIRKALETYMIKQFLYGHSKADGQQLFFGGFPIDLFVSLTDVPHHDTDPEIEDFIERFIEFLEKDLPT